MHCKLYCQSPPPVVSPNKQANICGGQKPAMQQNQLDVCKACCKARCIYKHIHGQKLPRLLHNSGTCTVAICNDASKKCIKRFSMRYLPVLRSHAAILLGSIVSLPFSASFSVHNLRRRSMPTTPNAVLFDALSEEVEVCSGAADADDVGGSTTEVVRGSNSGSSSMACSSSSCECNDC